MRAFLPPRFFISKLRRSQRGRRLLFLCQAKRTEVRLFSIPFPREKVNVGMCGVESFSAACALFSRLFFSASIFFPVLMAHSIGFRRFSGFFRLRPDKRKCHAAAKRIRRFNRNRNALTERNHAARSKEPCALFVILPHARKRSDGHNALAGVLRTDEKAEGAHGADAALHRLSDEFSIYRTR